MIDPAGHVAELDPTAATDEPSVRGAPRDASDQRKLDAPLPRLVVGSVVEEELVRTDHGALVNAGTDGRVQLGTLTATAATRVTISTATGQHVHLTEHALPAGVHARHAVANGRESWTYSLGALDLPETESDQPGDLFDHPTIGFTSIASWNALAHELRAAIDQKIAAGPPAWPAGIAKAATIETARAIVAWSRAQIRDLGIDVDAAGFPPATPADVVAHGSADDLSAATLVVALLRQAGLRADVVLVDVAPGIDAEPELVGLVGFDRAVVRAKIGGADVWIDPVDPYEPVGRLGSREHGRHALVLADDTTALGATPRVTLADAEVHEVRTYDVPESGFAHVLEVSRESGDFAASNRSWLTDSTAEAKTKQFSEYVDAHYGGVLESSSAPVGELEAPTELTLAVAHSHRASALREQLGVYLWPHDVVLRLSSPFQTRTRPRVHDLQLDTPYTYELENRIIIPDGYAMPARMTERVQSLGALFFTEHQKVDGHTFVVTYRLEVAKTRYTPAELEATRTAIAALEPEHIVLQSTTWQLVDQGKLRDALAEATRLASVHPREALHHENLAGLLVQLGAGESARREARLATQLEPKRAAAWTMLGWVLEHDAFGRMWGFDQDRAAARAAFEKARKLDPKYAEAAAELAGLLEVDARGHRIAGGADLRTAIAAWRDAYALEPTSEHALALGRALLWNGDAAGAEKVLRDTDGEGRDALLVVAIALGAQGTPAAMRELDQMSPSDDARKKLLAGSGQIALVLRAYDLARALFAQTDPSQITPTLPELLKRVVRRDDPFKPGKDPTDAVVELQLESLHPERARVASWDAETDKEVARRVRESIAQFDNAELPVALVNDLFRSALDFKVEGDASAWRVEVTSFGQHSTIYVAADRGTPKVIGAPDALESVGRHVLRLLAKHDDTAAKRVLDWVAADRPHEPFFASLWGTNLPIDHAEMLLAAAALAAPTDVEHVLPIATKCGATTTDGQLACDITVLKELESHKRWAEMVDFTTAWEARAAQAIAMIPLASHAAALAQLGHYDDAAQLVDSGLVHSPAAGPLLLLKMGIAFARGDAAEAWRRASAVITRAGATAHELNQAAWLGLYEGSELSVAVGAAREAVRLAPKNAAILNTLAGLEIELDDLHAGQTDALRAMKLDDRDRPDDADWYVVGRYWERLGLRDEAIAAYKRVTSKAGDAGQPVSSQFAARRLAALGVKR